MSTPTPDLDPLDGRPPGAGVTGGPGGLVRLPGGPVRRIVLVTHLLASVTGHVVDDVLAICAEAGVEVVLAVDEAQKHGLDGGRPDHVSVADGLASDPDLCVILGGDGTILRSLAHYLGTRTAVYGINYGRVGFLAAAERDDYADALVAALAGGYETLELPTLDVSGGGETFSAVNEVVVIRPADTGAAEVAVRLQGEDVASLRCDGVVAATPVGSTGYNLSVGGPVLAWGVHAFVVSYIAPHALDARPMVVPPDTVLTLTNTSDYREARVEVDGRNVLTLGSGERITVRLGVVPARLAVMAESTFFGRYRRKFTAHQG